MSPHRTRTAAAALVLLASTLAPALAAAGSTGPEVRARHGVRVVPPDARRAMVLDRGKRGYLGVDTLDLTPELRRHFDTDEKAGVLVSRVEPGSPAERAGLAVGDVLVAVEGKPVAGEWDLRRLVGPHKAGDAVTLDVVRDGRPQQLRATLEEREGHVIELGRLLGGEGGDGTMLVMPSAEEWARLGREMGRMGQELGASVTDALADPAVRLRIEEHVRDRETLQRRIDLLEKRLRELEMRLQEQPRR